MRTLPALALVALLALPASVTAAPLPISGQGVFLDPGEVVATLELTFLEPGCAGTMDRTGTAVLQTTRTFLATGEVKTRVDRAAMTCLIDGDALWQAWVLQGDADSNLNLAGSGLWTAPAKAFALAGTFRDGAVVVVV